MANMRTYISGCKTDGEKVFYTFCKEKLSQDYIVWSNIELVVTESGGAVEHEIDAAVYSDELGLILFEIKDWRIGQIEGISNQFVRMEGGKRNKNPYVNLKQKVYTLMSKMRRYDVFLQKEKNLKVPVNVAIVLPYITKKEWEKKLESLGIDDPDFIKMSPWVMLFKEDMVAKRSFKTKDEAFRKLDGLRASNLRYPSKLASKEIDWLDKMFGAPDDKGSLFKIRDEDKKVWWEDNLIALDSKQVQSAETIMRRMIDGPGHFIITGVAGSGKSLLLFNIFRKAASYPDMRIAYVGRQRELVEDFKDKIEDAGICVDSPDYMIDTFHNFIEKKHGIPQKDDGTYISEDEFTRFVAKKIDDAVEEFDVMLIDEGHNLPDEWIRYLVNSTKRRKKGNVVYVEDYEQNIFNTERDKKGSGLDYKGGREELLVNYRNTREITQFALQITEKYTLCLDESVISTHRSGPVPEIMVIEGNTKGGLAVYNVFSKWRGKGVAANDITIIYPSSDLCEGSLFGDIIETFGANNYKCISHYPAEKISEKFGPKYTSSVVSKRERPVPKNGINLITTFSTQGLSYKCVIVLMDRFKLDRWTIAQARNMMYISLTRATHDMAVVFENEDDCYKRAEAVVSQMKNPIISGM